MTVDEEPRSVSSGSASQRDFLKRLRLAVKQTERRLRARGGLAASVTVARWLGGGLLAPLVAARLWAPAWVYPIAAVFPLGTLVAFLVTYARGSREAKAARALDASHDVFDGVTIGLELGRRLDAGLELDGFRALTLARMEQTIPPLSARRAVPRLVPPGWWGVVSWSLGVGVLAFVPGWQRSGPPVAAEPAGSSPPALAPPLPPERWAELRRQLEAALGRELGRQLGDELLGWGTEEDPTEALRRLEAWEAELRARAEVERAFAEGLGRRGQSLGETRTTRELVQALRSGAAEEVARALERLAERLRDPHEKLSQRELDELRRAVEQMRQARDEEARSGESSSGSAERERLEERARRLREQREREGGLPPEAAAELERAERSLERLGRRRQELERTLDELDRRLAEAAQALAEEQRRSEGFERRAAESMQRAAEELERSAERALDPEEKEELLRQIEALREELRRRRESGEAEEDPARRAFERRARGDEGEPGDGSRAPAGGGSRSVPLPVPGTSGGAGRGQPSGEPEGSGAPTKGPGESAGSKHEERIAGDASPRVGATTQDVSAVAQDSGGGPSQRETIRAAARSGFARGPYQSLYRDYRAVAEEIMRRDTIPPGYKSHVERYFEMIRPRAAAARPEE